MTRLLVGCYTPDRGTGTGITVVDDGAVTSIVPASSPSWIALHPDRPVLYAVAETDAGGVAAWSLVDGIPTEPFGTGETGGADPCHLTVDATGGYLVTVNYTGGSVAVHRLDADGRIGDRTDLVSHQRAGNHERQGAAHPHMVRSIGDHLFVTDLGGDAIYQYHLDDGRLVLDRIIDTPAGSGPRHLLLIGSHFVVTAELSAEILVFDAGWHLIGRVPASTAPTESLVSELATDGRFLYVANRGANTLSVFTLAGDLPEYVTEVPTGDWPRHIAVDGDRLYVANQLSDEVTTMRIDATTGIPAVVTRLSTPSPTHVLTC